MAIKTVRVSNVSLNATEKDIREFFSFSGDIDQIELRSETELSQEAYITFKNSQAVHTALLLAGATIVDRPVNMYPVGDDKERPGNLLQDSPLSPQRALVGGVGTSLGKAEDTVTSMLAKGFVLGKDAVNRAKSFDEKLQLTATASSTVMSFDKKIGLTEKITMGTAAMNERVRNMDQKFQFSEKAKSAIAAAEEKVNNAGSALMKNKFVFIGAAWVSGAFGKVTNVAKDVGLNSKEKITVVELQKSDQDSMAGKDLQ